MKRHLALFAALFLAPTVGKAEVRLHAGDAGPALLVEPVAQGVWTPSGVPDMYTVNPGGDLLGDGYPAHARTSGRLVAAWQRPMHGKLVVLQATSATIFTTVEVPIVDGVGVPIVTSLGSGSLVTWQSGSAVPEVMAVVADGRDVSPPFSIVRGRLIGVYRVGDSIHIVAFDKVALALDIRTIPAHHFPSPIPIPALSVPLFRTFGAAPLEASPPPEFVTRPATWLPCVEERGTDVLLAWRAGRSVLGRVTLDAYGVEGAGEFYRGPNGSCEAVLNAAARD